MSHHDDLPPKYEENVSSTTLEPPPPYNYGSIDEVGRAIPGYQAEPVISTTDYSNYLANNDNVIFLEQNPQQPLSRVQQLLRGNPNIDQRELKMNRKVVVYLVIGSTVFTGLLVTILLAFN